ncbi:MAG: tRNA (adenosine(37)-N6)-threonylcarbamoyltransferase complex transferase subunit TsaD [Rhodothermales bacterium]|nr:tRNA (adenosine(37)-N6)-threonylcarbamoyltransferase complex transferase subunit TsaD [Rhodothermales bacterium]
MAVAVLRGRSILSTVVASQTRHEAFGGVVPEIASRAHLRLVTRTVETALAEASVRAEDLEAIAVTRGPGLPGSLIVGTSFARGFGDALGLPVYGVNHLEGHLYSTFIEQAGPELPFLSLIVSGGHTQLVLVRNAGDIKILGRTRDDAAGEAFDKTGKLLGLGYPAGPEIDSLAADGDASFHRFPRTQLDGLDYSFSGIKTSVLYYLNRFTESEREKLVADKLNDICASFQAAVVEMLLSKFGQAIEKSGVSSASIVGGVSANTELQRRALELCKEKNVKLYFPPRAFCTDNAAMIGVAAQMGALQLIDSLGTEFIAPNLNL